MKLTVIGTGYLGATHAAAMAELGHEVLGVDVDDARSSGSRGEVPFFEPGLPELLARSSRQRRLRFTTSYEDAGASATCTSSAWARRRRRVSTPPT